MKTCTNCGTTKPESEFNKCRGMKDGLRNWCRECTRAYCRGHYQRNQRKYIDKKQKNKLKIRQTLLDYLRTHPCIDCGENEPACLDFDHRDSSQKSFTISTAAVRILFSLKTLREEIAKCDVRCANCHRKRTAVEQGWYATLTGH